MTIYKLLIIAAGWIVLSSCTPKRVSQNFYEGIRLRNYFQSLPSIYGGNSELPPYSLYEKERLEQLSPEGHGNLDLRGELR